MASTFTNKTGLNEENRRGAATATVVRSAMPLLPVPFQDPNVDPIVANFVEKKELGHGSFGRVVSGTTVDADNNPIEVAKKIMHVDISRSTRPSKVYKSVAQEVTMLQLIVPYKIYNAYIETDRRTQSSHLVLLMELIHGESGYFYTSNKKYLTPSEATDLLVYLLSAAGCMDTFGAVHRDIKPENIIYKYASNPSRPSEENEIVLVDWGISCRYVDPDFFPTCNVGSLHGTAEYISPYMYAASERSPAVLQLIRNIRPCLSEEATKLADAALESRQRAALKAFIHTPEVSHLILRMNDLWAIAFTVLEMGGVTWKNLPIREMYDNKEYERIADMLASLQLRALGLNLEERGWPKKTIHVLLRILDYSNQFVPPMPCPTAAQLLAKFYGKAPSKDDMCGVLRQRKRLPFPSKSMPVTNDGS